MTPEQIYKAYKLSNLAELAGITFSYTFDSITDEIEGMVRFERRWYRTYFKRNGKKISFKMFNTTDVNTALNNLRVDIDLLFNITETGEENYLKWKELYISEIGEGDNIKRSTFNQMVSEYKKMRSFLEEWFPVLLYAEQDI